MSCSVEGTSGRFFNEERRTQSYAGGKGATTMLEQILEPGKVEEEKKEEEKGASQGLWRKITLLPGFGILLAIGCVLVGQVTNNIQCKLAT